MKRSIIFANQATGYLTLDIVNTFAASGYFEQIELFAGEINIRPTLPLSNVKVVKTLPYNKRNVVSRLVSWLLGYIHLLLYVWLKPNSFELFLITNPPFNVFIPLLSRKKYSLLIYDIYPDTLVSQRVAGSNSLLVKLWKRMNNKVFAKADHVFTISDDMKKEVSAYVEKEKIKVIYNWGHNEHMKPVQKSENSFLNTNNLKDKFIVLYSGNIGKTHDVDRLVDIAIRLKEDNKFMFVMIGEGGKKESIRQRVSKEQLDNFLILPFQPLQVLPHSMGSADVCLVTTDLKQSTLSIPSKTYSFLSVGSAFMCITDKDSELAHLVDSQQIGKCFSAHETDKMVEFLKYLSCNEDILNNMKARSRQLSFDYTPENARKYLKAYIEKYKSAEYHIN